MTWYQRLCGIWIWPWTTAWAWPAWGLVPPPPPGKPWSVGMRGRRAAPLVLVLVLVPDDVVGSAMVEWPRVSLMPEKAQSRRLRGPPVLGRVVRVLVVAVLVVPSSVGSERRMRMSTKTLVGELRTRVEVGSEGSSSPFWRG